MPTKHSDDLAGKILFVSKTSVEVPQKGANDVEGHEDDFNKRSA